MLSGINNSGEILQINSIDLDMSLELKVLNKKTKNNEADTATFLLLLIGCDFVT